MTLYFCNFTNHKFSLIFGSLTVDSLLFEVFKCVRSKLKLRILSPIVTDLFFYTFFEVVFKKSVVSLKLCSNKCFFVWKSNLL